MEVENPARSFSPIGRRAAETLAFALGYAALVTLSYQISIPPLGVSAVWFPNGLAFGVLLRESTRSWPRFLVAVFIADAVATWLAGIPLPVAIVWSLGDVAECIFGAWLLLRTIGSASTLSRVRDVFAFSAITFLVAPLATIPFAALSTVWFPGASFAEIESSWWPNGGLGTFAVGAVVLTWTWREGERPPASRLLAIASVAAGFAGFFAAAFHLNDLALASTLVAFATSPILTFAALRFGPKGASATALALGSVALWQTVEGRGPFALIGSLLARILAVQGFFALATFSALVLAAAAEERRRLREEAVDHARRIEESLALLDTLIGNAPIGFAFLDRDLRFVRWNQALVEANDVSDRDLTGRTLREVVPSIAPRVEAMLRQALETEEPIVGIEVTVERPGRKGGRAFWLCSAYPVQIRKGPPLGVGAVVVDITHRKKEEERLALSEERFRSLAVATSEIIWTTDADGVIREDSPSWRSFTGQTREEWLAGRWIDAIHPADRDEAVATWWRGVEAGTPFSNESRVRRRDGVYRYFESRIAPVLDEDGSVREWVGMNLDITARKEAEAERARFIRKSQEAIRLRDDFLSIASHEMKTPLTPLSVWLQVMKRRLASGKSIDAALVDKARASLDRLTALINDLLDASRIQARGLTFVLEPVSLTQVVREQVAQMAQVSAEHPLELEAPEEEIWVMGERPRLEQVLSNLLDNAIKYSPDGGPVGVGLAVTGAEVVLSVSDEGIGIPEDEQRRLFDRFFRARNISASSYGGLGLGLYIVRDVVEHHGGRIWVKSKPGEGSTFFVSLPRLVDGSEVQAALPPAE